MSEKEQPSQLRVDEIAALSTFFSNIFLQSLPAALNPPEYSEQNILNPDLCQHCQSLTFEKLISGFQVHSNYGELLTRAFTCPLCRILLSALINQPADNWWGDEEPLISDKVSAKLVRDARQLNKFPERLEVTVFRPDEEVVKILMDDQYAKNPDVRLLKHAIVCVDMSELIIEGWILRYDS